MTEFELKVLKRKIRELEFDDKYIFSNGTLTLNLANQNLTDAQLIEIAEALPWNPLITKVILSNNNINLKGAMALLNNNLTSQFVVDLSGNPVVEEKSETLESLKKVYENNGKILILEQPIASLRENDRDEIEEKDIASVDPQNAAISKMLLDAKFSIEKAVNTIVKSKNWDIINPKNFIALMSKITAHYQTLQSKSIACYKVLTKKQDKGNPNNVLLRLISTYLNRISLIIDKEVVLKFSSKIKEQLLTFNPEQIVNITHIMTVLGLKEKSLVEELAAVLLENLNQFSVGELLRIQKDFMNLQIDNKEVLESLSKQFTFQLKYSTIEEKIKVIHELLNTPTPRCLSIEELRRDCIEIALNLARHNNKDLQELLQIDTNQNTMCYDSVSSSSSMSQVNIHSRKRFLTQYSLVQFQSPNPQFPNRSQTPTPMPRSNTENANNLLLDKPYPRKFQRSLTPTH